MKYQTNSQTILKKRCNPKGLCLFSIFPNALAMLPSPPTSTPKYKSSQVTPLRFAPNSNIIYIIFQMT